MRKQLFCLVAAAVGTIWATPFAFTDVTPNANNAADQVMTRRFGPFPLPKVDRATWVAMGSGGLTNLANTVGSYAFLAIVDPKTRHGYVAGWLTDEWASGSVHFGPEGLVFQAEYGRLKTGGDVSAQKDTFVLGEFDDCRLGLEAYADEAAKRNGVKLPPQISGFCTWYCDKGGFTTDKTKPFRGACSTEMTRTFIDEVRRVGLEKWGFDYYQIDDTWQDGVKRPGPAKVFCRIDPNGPYPEGMKPTADYIAAKGFVPGLWYMPFSGEPSDPWWKDKMDLFVTCAVDAPAKGIRKKQVKGAPYETVFGAGALDLSNPKTVAYVKETASRLTKDWGYRLLKFDGMYSGMAVELGYGRDYRPDDLGNQIFKDPTISNVQAFRRGVRAMREGSAPGTQLLACNVKQNARGIAASYGLVEMLRIGGDNGPIDYIASRYMAGPLDGSPRYFLNGRLWYNDPDPVYVRNAVSLGRARLMASWTAIGGLLYNFSDWLPDLSAERVDILKRTLAPHRLPKQVRPVDYFDHAIANVWKLTDGDRAVYGLYNWNTNTLLKVDYSATYADLDPAKTYVGFDFWANKPVPAFKGRFAFEVPPDACRVIAVRECLPRPFVLSSSRHVASPIFDLPEERWDAATCTLTGISTVVANEDYELRLHVPANFTVAQAPGATVVQEGSLVRLTFRPAAVRLPWRVVFARHLLANGNFENVANGKPVGWTASSAAGGFVAPGKGVNGSTALGVEGVGTNNCKWLSAPVLLEPNRLYGFSVKVNAHQGGGLTMGTPDENVTESFADTQGEWVEKRMVVVSADRPKPYGEVFRLGEYRLNGRFLFDEACVVPLVARYAEKDGVQLGHGEKLGGNAYSFSTRLSCAARVHARPLYRQRIGFNSTRWSFGKGQSITYRHALAGRRLLSGKAFFTCGVLPPGSGAKIVVEASTDGKTWVKVGEQVEIPAPGIAFDLPTNLFPAENVYVRFGGERLMVDGYTFTGDVDGSPVYLAGETKYVNEQDGSVFIEEGAGPSVVEEACGARLPAAVAGGVLWTASSGWKIPRRRLAPTATVDAVRVKTAANEAEAVQLCLTADEDFADVRVTVKEDAVAKTWGLIEKGRLAASCIQVERMGYVPVNRVTDYLGSVGLHADPILPQTPKALVVAKGETQPFWIRVKPPKGTTKGVYQTTLTVCARTPAGEVRQAEVPLEIEVFGFTLPDTMTLKVPFGFGAPTVFRFHRAKTEAQRELLFERYLQALADCHISPYTLTRAQQKVTWTKDGQPVLDWAAWDEGVEKAMAKYHFTSIRISSLGLGSGNEAVSWPGQVPGTNIKEGSPDYELLVGRYLKAVQDHFEQKGWLDKVFVYCYDEPQSSADAFVMRGFGLLEKYAPKLRRMLTAPPRDSLIGGPHIWCPVAPGLQSSNTPKRRAAGDEFWWYCCMCPRAPYLSLFIDHPGVELRTWLWQTWGEKLTGALIWNTTWWTSDLIYPKGKPPQNAYEDTMSWSPRAWRPGTNGDGRMFYPPPACFDGGTEFVDAMPVPTRRVEMIRDGVEDYEYFAMLRRKNPNHPLLQVPADVYSSLTAYNYDPAALEAHREKLARALED